MKRKQWNLRDDIVRPDGTVPDIDRTRSPAWVNSVRAWLATPQQAEHALNGYWYPVGYWLDDKPVYRWRWL